MERATTLFLKAAVFLMAIPILALCIIGLPRIVKEAVEYYSGWVFLPVFTGLYVAAIPYFVALNEAFKLLGYIDRNTAFSELSVRALKKIKYCAITISALFVAVLPLLYLMAEKDDAPGIIVIGLVIAFASLVIAVFAAVLQKLLKNAIDIKSENDLTV